MVVHAIDLDAASVQQQDLTSFVLGAVMERARSVLAEDRILRLTPHEVNQLERALDSEPEVIPQLRAFIRRISVDHEGVSQKYGCLSLSLAANSLTTFSAGSASRQV